MRNLKTLMAFAGFASVQALPSFNVNIAPVFNGSEVDVLNITLKINDPRLKANTTFLHAYTMRYSGANDLTASDMNGPLPIVLASSGNRRNWTATRDAVGQVDVQLIAVPDGDIKGLYGRADLRYDHGSVFGQFKWFVPSPPADEMWDISVTWDIPEAAKAQTHFASSMNGRDTRGKSLVGVPAKTLDLAALAVGQNLNRWPAWDADIKMEGGHDFAFYWVGDLPWDAMEVAPQVAKIFNGTATYFQDFDTPMHVFFRRDWNEYGGVGGFQSFIMEYLTTSPEEHSFDHLTTLISHELIHEYALVWPETSTLTWYVEGIADYLGLVTPFLSGAINHTHWVRWMNDQAQDYCTGSAINTTIDEIMANYQRSPTRGVKTPYTRGSMYFAYLQGLIQDATAGAKNIDDVLLAMFKLYRDGKTVGKEEFLQLVGAIIGKDAANNSFETMANGTLMIPARHGYIKYGVEAVRTYLPKYSLGMSEGSLGLGNVTSLVAGSEAEKAGIKEGDKIIDYITPWTLMDTLDSKQRMTIERDGKQIKVEYTPRDFNTLLECWQWVDVAVKH
jgi:hypothetical protein